MRGLIFGFSITRSIAAAAELNIADRLADGPRTAAELASECGALERPLYRMLRALAGEGVFAEALRVLKYNSRRRSGAQLYVDAEVAQTLDESVRDSFLVAFVEVSLAEILVDATRAQDVVDDNQN